MVYLVKVSFKTTTIIPTTTTTIATTTTSVQNQIKYTLGDVNSDGNINAVDASEILSEYARISTNQNSQMSTEQKKAADVDENGSINAVDASQVLSYYAYKATSGTMEFEEYLVNPPVITTKVTTTITTTITTPKTNTTNTATATFADYPKSIMVSPYVGSSTKVNCIAKKAQL